MIMYEFLIQNYKKGIKIKWYEFIWTENKNRYHFSLLTNLDSQPIHPRLRLIHKRSSKHSKRSLIRRQSKSHCLLGLILHSKSTHFALFWVQNQILKITLVTKSSTNILQIIWTLQIVSLQKPISRCRALTSISHLITAQVNSLYSQNSVVFIDPYINSDDQRFVWTIKLIIVLKSSLFSYRSTFFLYPCKTHPPFFRLWFLVAYHHPTLFVTFLWVLPHIFAFTRHTLFLRKLYTNFRPRRLRNIRQQMLDIKLILINLFLYLFLNLRHSTIVLTLQLSPIIIIITK